MTTTFITVDNVRYKVELSDNCTKIYDSWQLDTDEKKKSIISLISICHTSAFGHRSMQSLVTEIKAHNAMYKHNIKVDHTKDVDLEHVQKWYHAVGFFIVNLFLKE